MAVGASRHGRLVALVLLLASALACGERKPAPARPQAAAEAIAGLRTELGAALGTALAQGPEHAVETCRLEAPRITARQQRPAVAVGRTSDRVRNPANAPEPWMQPLLDEFRGRAPEPDAYRTADLGARGTGYVEPIYLQPVCATCHGRNVDPGLLDVIRERYPSDQATGFEVGELRGLFWAVVAPGRPGGAMDERGETR